MYIHIYTYIYMISVRCIQMYVCLIHNYVCTYVYIIYIYIYIYTYTPVYSCVCVPDDACLYTHIYICVHTYDAYLDSTLAPTCGNILVRRIA